MLDPKRFQINIVDRPERSYLQIHKGQSRSRSHDKGGNRHCVGNRVADQCLGMTPEDFKNEWQKDKGNYLLLKTMRVAYKLMAEETHFLRLLKILDG